MKAKFEILEMNQDDLADLFSTATYGNDWLDIDLEDRADYFGTQLESPKDCREDVWAKVLLDGKCIVFYDYNAEGEDENYGNKRREWNALHERMEYHISLEDIYNGINKAASSNNAYATSCVGSLVSQDYDLNDAEEIMQWIIFGEPIYG